MATLLNCVNRDSFIECEELINAGIDINAKLDHNNTVVHYATHNLEILELLLSRGGDPNSKNSNGYTPLHCAVQEGGVDAITILIKFKADIEAQNCDGKSPLAISTDPEVTKLLLSYGANPYSTDNNGVTVMESTTKRSCVKILKKWEQSYHGGFSKRACKK